MPTPRVPLSSLLVSLFACGVLLAPRVAGAAPPAAPEQVSYQGLLLDSLGDPRTGSVDLTLRVFDAVSGGTLVYVQSFSAVPLADGVFTVVLGPTGAATDTPVNPLTTSLRDALAGDVGATGPSRFLEVTVGAEGALARTQILAAPYALTSADTQAVGGVSEVFVSQLFQYGNADDTGPLNSDAAEGLGDTDGDGLANFVDPNNDDDGILDGDEAAIGGDINLVTPTITGFVPPTADGFVTSTVTVQGTNFDPGLSVVFGTEAPAPSNLTPTSFDVQVGPQPKGTANVQVTLPNAESATSTFDFFFVVPDVVSVSPPDALASAVTRVLVSGSNFEPGMTVDFGAETPTPLNLTATSFEADVGPAGVGFVDVTVTLLNGESDTLVSAFEFTSNAQHSLPVVAKTQLSFDATSAGQTVLGGVDSYAVDTDSNMVPETIVPFATEAGGDAGTPGQLAVAWDPVGNLAGIRCRTVASFDCDVEITRDSDADFDLADETPVVLQSLVDGFARILSPSLEFDPSGNLVAGYVRQSLGTGARVAHDRDGDGLFTGTNELVEIEGLVGAPTNLGEVAVDGSGRVAYVYFNASLSALRVAWDRSGDGDFDDTVGGNPELFTLASLPTAPLCLGADFAPDGDLSIVYDDSTAPIFARDRNGDGDFDEVGEVVALDSSPPGACDVEGGPALAVTHNADGSLRLLVDRNGDEDFADTDENVVLLVAGSGVENAQIAFGSANRALVATEDEILVDPIP